MNTQQWLTPQLVAYGGMAALLLALGALNIWVGSSWLIGASCAVVAATVLWEAVRAQG